MSSNIEKTSQEKFNEKYITSSEIVKELGISRPAVLYARRNGILPDAIKIDGINVYLWEREKIMSRLKDYQESINARRKLARK